MLFGIALGLSSFNAYAAATPPAGGRVLQCWFDEKGQRTCSDTLPPKEARRQRELLDQRGLTKKILPAQKTPEEYEARKQQFASIALDNSELDSSNSSSSWKGSEGHTSRSPSISAPDNVKLFRVPS